MATEQEERPALGRTSETPVPDRPGATGLSHALIAGSRWFPGEGRPYMVRMDLPLSAREMVAALYGDHERLVPADLDTDEELYGHVAVVVVQDGLRAVERLADLIDQQQSRRTLAAPEWLGLCRRRVAEVTTGDPWAWM
jgi:hypothetical protein